MHEETISQFKRRKVRFAKKLRQRMTKTEELLWSELRGKKLDGLKFRRQVPIGAYIVDFLCVEQELIIELDGGVHLEQQEKDAYREQILQKRGYKILRFTNDEVFSDINGVLRRIKDLINNS